MTKPPLQIYEPSEPSHAAEEPGGAIVHKPPEDGVTASECSSPGHRIVWWLSLAVLLPVGLGVLQMLALLVQAERVRGALQEGLATAHLPKAYLRDVELAIVSRPGSRQLFEHLRTANDPKYNLIVKCPYRTNNLSRIMPLSMGDLITADFRVSTSNLLPRWLGPRLPLVGADEVQVHWQVTVGQE